MVKDGVKKGNGYMREFLVAQWCSLSSVVKFHHHYACFDRNRHISPNSRPMTIILLPPDSQGRGLHFGTTLRYIPTLHNILRCACTNRHNVTVEYIPLLHHPCPAMLNSVDCDARPN